MDIADRTMPTTERWVRTLPLHHSECAIISVGRGLTARSVIEELGDRRYQLSQGEAFLKHDAIRNAFRKPTHGRHLH
ncbi:hypothetical protein D9M69_132130 [compost metagenome]